MSSKYNADSALSILKGGQTAPQYVPTTQAQQDLTKQFINDSYTQLDNQYNANKTYGMDDALSILNTKPSTPQLSQQDYFNQQDQNTITGLKQNLMNNNIDVPNQDTAKPGFLTKLGDRLSLLLYPTAGAINNALSDDPNKHWYDGVKAGIDSALHDTEAGKVTYKDVLNTLLTSQNATKQGIGDAITNTANIVNPWAWSDINKQGLSHDVALKHHDFAGFLGDMALDPAMYIGLGETGKVLSKGSEALNGAEKAIGSVNDATTALSKLGLDSGITNSEALYNKTAKLLGYAPDAKGITFAGHTIPGLSAENIGKFADSSLGKVVGLPFDALDKVGTALKDSKIGQGLGDLFLGGKYQALIKDAKLRPESALNNVAFADYLKRSGNLKTMALDGIVEKAKELQGQIGNNNDAVRKVMETPDTLVQKAFNVKEVDAANPVFEEEMNNRRTLLQTEYEDLQRQLEHIDKTTHGADPEALRQVTAIKEQQKTLESIPALEGVKFDEQLGNAGIGFDRGTVERISRLSDILYNPMVAHTASIDEVTNMFKQFRDKGAIDYIDDADLSDLALKFKHAADSTVENITKTYPELSKYYTGSSIKNGVDVIKRGMSTPSKQELILERTKVSQQMKEAAATNDTEELAKLEARRNDLTSLIETGDNHSSYGLNTHSKDTADIGYPELVKHRSVLAERLKGINPKNTKVIEKMKEDIANIDKELETKTPLEQFKMDNKIKNAVSNSELSSRPLNGTNDISYEKKLKENDLRGLPDTLMEKTLTKEEYARYKETGNLNHLSKYAKSNAERVKFHYDNLMSKGFYPDAIEKMSPGTVINKSKEFLNPDLGEMLKDVPVPTGKNQLLNKENYTMAVKDARTITEKQINPFTNEAIKSVEDYNRAKEMFSKQYSMTNMDNLNEFGRKMSGEAGVKKTANFQDGTVLQDTSRDVDKFAQQKLNAAQESVRGTKLLDLNNPGVKATMDRILKVDPSADVEELRKLTYKELTQRMNGLSQIHDILGSEGEFSKQTVIDNYIKSITNPDNHYGVVGRKFDELNDYLKHNNLSQTDIDYIKSKLKTSNSANDLTIKQGMERLESQLGKTTPTNNIIDLSARRTKTETPITRITEQSQNPVKKVTQDNREFLKFDTKNGTIYADAGAKPNAVNALGDNILNRPEELKNVNANTDITMMHGSIGKGETGGELKGMFDNTTKRDITLSDKTTPNELTGTINHETAHAFGNNEWHANRTASSITKDMASWTPQDMTDANNLFKSVGRVIGNDSKHITAYLDELSKAGVKKVTMNQETLAEFGSVFLHNDPLVRQEAQRLFPQGYDKMLDLVSKLPEGQLKELVPKGVSAKDEILAKLNNMKDVTKVFDEMNVTKMVEAKAIGDRIAKLDELFNSSDAYKTWFKENYKEYPEFIKVAEPMMHTTNILSPLNGLPEEARKAAEFMRNSLKEAGIKEGVIDPKDMNELYSYFPHVLNWDLKENKTASGLFNKQALFDPSNMNAKERTIQGTIESINKYMKETHHIDNFFETNVVRAYSERMIAHNNFVFKQENLQKALDLFGTRIDKDVYTALGSPEAKQNYYLKVQDMLDSGEYDVVRTNDKLETVQKNVVGDETLSKAKADQSPYNDYIKLDPKEVKLEDLFQNKKQPIYLVQKDTHKVLEQTMAGQKKQMDNALVKIYDKFQGLWKSSALFSVSFNFNNAVGNTFNSYMGAGAKILDPILNKDALLANMGKGAHGGMSGAEWKRIATEYGAIGDDFSHGDLMDFRSGKVDTIGKTPLQQISANPLSKDFAPVKGARALSGTIESQARMANFMAHVDSGKSYQEAADMVNKFLFDYSDLTDFETNTMKRIVPFYTWLRKNIPLQVENLFKQPGKYDRILRGTADASKPETEDQKNVRPDYLSNAIHLGNGKYIDPRLPLEDLTRFKSLSDVMGGVTPIIKTPLEEMFNKNLFLNAPIAKQDGEKVAAPLYTQPIATDTPKGKMIDAKLAYVLKSFLPSVEGISNAVQAYTDPKSQNSTDKANAFTGMNTLGARVYSTDTEKLKSYATQNYIKKLQDAEANSKEQGSISKTSAQLKANQDKQDQQLKLLEYAQKLQDSYRAREITYEQYQQKLIDYKAKQDAYYKNRSYTSGSTSSTTASGILNKMISQAKTIKTK